MTISIKLYFIPARAIAQAPRFVERMSNVSVKEGQAVTLAAAAKGVPTPMMSWQKDGHMLVSEGKITT